MRLVRFLRQGKVCLGIWDRQNQVLPLQGQRTEITSLPELLILARRQQLTLAQLVQQLVDEADCRPLPYDPANLLIPLAPPEVWAAGVTYQRSRDARNEESTANAGASVYDRVYAAARPELFLKSTASRTVGPYEPVRLRRDSAWQVPEPELGLVLTKDAQISGFTVGNDMSCRDIEGENPLYLPQAKIWSGSCAIGPAVLLAETVVDPYAFQIEMRILRAGCPVFVGRASTRQLKRKYDELTHYLQRDNVLCDGTVLLTGTCIVPPTDFTLQSGDQIEIEISDIGTLVNSVA